MSAQPHTSPPGAAPPDAARRGILERFIAQPSVRHAVEAAGRLKTIVDDGRHPVRIAVLRNITLEQVQPFVEARCAQLGLNANLWFAELDTAERDVRDSDGPLFEFRPDLIVIAMRISGIAPALVDRFNTLSEAARTELSDAAHDRVVGIVRAIRARVPATVLVHNFEVPSEPAAGILDASSPGGQINTLRRLNLRLAETLSDVVQAYVIDVDHLLSKAGYQASLDDRFWHVARAPYSAAALDAFARCYAQFGAALKGRSRKCLVLDCDNTLWGGVVGEEGLGGIALGTAHPGSGYRGLQLAALDLFHRGVLLAINSKNNHADVLDVLQHHPDCVLRPEHFACMKINWQDKVANLREIAGELNLGIDSLVFIDDNPVECDYVRQALPEVEVVYLSGSPSGYERLLRSVTAFDTLAVTAEDLDRTAMYQAERARRAVLDQVGSYEDYLRSLEMVVTIARDAPVTAPRVAQLTQKTNQFNLTTRRYAESEIAQMIADPAVTVYSIRLADRFGDSGLIGASIVRRDGAAAVVDSLLLSCRVIGRGVEDALLAQIAADAAAGGSRSLHGEYRPTARNQMTADFFPKHGFADTGEGRFVLSLGETPPNRPPWFRSITVD